jgi:hypothetical protein
MNRKDIYEITLKVQEQYQMAGLGAPESEMCLYADFAVDVAVRAIRLKLNEMANEVDAMPFGDTGASFAVWIRNQE